MTQLGDQSDLAQYRLVVALAADVHLRHLQRHPDASTQSRAFQTSPYPPLPRRLASRYLPKRAPRVRRTGASRDDLVFLMRNALGIG